MSSELVHAHTDRAIATVVLDSPGNRNALSAQLVAELSDHLAAAAQDASVRAIVLTHTGSVFCSGADLREAAAEGGPEHGTARMVTLLQQLIAVPKPVLARIDGHVRAGGIGLVGACDIALAGSSTSFAFTEVRLGIAPAIISLTTLGRMSERAAARYYLTGETFDADVAAAVGLITMAASDLDAELEALLAALRQCSPQGLAATKPLVCAALAARFAAGAERMQALSAQLFASPDARAGMTAFLQRQPAPWVVES